MNPVHGGGVNALVPDKKRPKHIVPSFCMRTQKRISSFDELPAVVLGLQGLLFNMCCLDLVDSRWSITSLRDMA